MVGAGTNDVSVDATPGGRGYRRSDARQAAFDSAKVALVGLGRLARSEHRCEGAGCRPRLGRRRGQGRRADGSRPRPRRSGLPLPRRRWDQRRFGRGDLDRCSHHGRSADGSAEAVHGRSGLHPLHARGSPSWLPRSSRWQGRDPSGRRSRPHPPDGCVLRRLPRGVAAAEAGGARLRTLRRPTASGGRRPRSESSVRSRLPAGRPHLRHHPTTTGATPVGLPDLRVRGPRHAGGASRGTRLDVDPVLLRTGPLRRPTR